MGLHLTVGIVPLGDIPLTPLKVIVAHISTYFDLRAQILQARSIPAASFDAQRLQYNVGHILDNLEKGATNPCHKTIGVLNVDLFAPVFTYVLGEARQGGDCALVSLSRLKECAPGDRCEESVFLTRTAKVALHELGHLFSLGHCDDSDCLMHFSGSAKDLDHRRLRLCRYCNLFLQEKTAIIEN